MITRLITIYASLWGARREIITLDRSMHTGQAHEAWLTLVLHACFENRNYENNNNKYLINKNVIFNEQYFYYFDMIILLINKNE